MAKIKLLEVDEIDGGTKRFQSQLLVGKDSVDFIMRDDGVMRHYENRENRFDFYPYHEPFEIIQDPKDMRFQEL